MHCKIEFTAEHHPTFSKGNDDKFWPFSAIFAIFARFLFAQLNSPNEWGKQIVVHKSLKEVTFLHISIF